MPGKRPNRRSHLSSQRYLKFSDRGHPLAHPARRSEKALLGTSENFK
jgi:hypothetical protein